jgi:hypothetical protein
VTDDVMEWVAAQVRRFRLAERSVLEVGSRDVNGTVRSLFTGPYFGIDKGPGPGVDAVVDIESPALGLVVKGLYGVVVSTEMLEHTPRPWIAVRRMAGSLEHGGPLLLTTRGFMFGHHDFPADYYRFSEEAVRVLMDDADLIDIETWPDPGNPGVFALGWRL